MSNTFVNELNERSAEPTILLKGNVEIHGYENLLDGRRELISSKRPYCIINTHSIYAPN